MISQIIERLASGEKLSRAEITELTREFRRIELLARRSDPPQVSGGDMAKATYDTNEDGVVDAAANADTVDNLHANAFAEAAHTHEAESLTAVGRPYNNVLVSDGEDGVVLMQPTDLLEMQDSTNIGWLTAAPTKFRPSIISTGQPAGKLLTSNGVGYASWQDPAAPAAHSHSGDDITSAVLEADSASQATYASDADTVDGQHAAAFAAAAHTHEAADLNATGATDGHVLTADGAGGAAWEEIVGFSHIGQAVWTFENVLEVGDNVFPIDNRMGEGKTITQVFLRCVTAPTGADLIIDIHDNGTTIFTNQANRPKITAGSNTGYTVTIDDYVWEDGHTMTCHIDQVGSTVAGEDLVVILVYKGQGGVVDGTVPNHDHTGDAFDGGQLDHTTLTNIGTRSHADIDTAISQGWFIFFATCTYASAHSFTVGGNLTGNFHPGTKIRLTNDGSVKYFIVQSSSYSAPTTTVNLIPNTSYSLVNSAITLTYYSYAETPQGWPGWFAYTPTWTSASDPQPALGDGTFTARFMVQGRKCSVNMYFYFGSTSTGGTGAWRFSLPVQASNSFLSAIFGVGRARVAGSPGSTDICFPWVAANMTYLSMIQASTPLNNYSATIPWTWAAGNYFSIYVEYEW